MLLVYLVQIPQKAVEGLFVGIMVFPVVKVADVAGAAEGGGPGFGGVHDGIIKADGEEDGLAGMAVFAFEGGGDFAFDPGAFDGVLGEDDHDFVVDPDGVFDAIPEAVADFKVFRSEPDADTIRLEIGVKTVSKLLVFAGVADEAGVELNGL